MDRTLLVHTPRRDETLNRHWTQVSRPRIESCPDPYTSDPLPGTTSLGFPRTIGKGRVEDKENDSGEGPNTLDVPEERNKGDPSGRSVGRRVGSMVGGRMGWTVEVVRAGGTGRH